MSKLEDEKKFINDLIETFPTIKHEVLDEDYQGLLTLQIGCFKRFTQKAINEDSLELVEKCFKFIYKKIGIVEHTVENSVVISYLGKLDIVPHSKIEKLLPKKLKEIRNDLNSYYQSSSKNEKLNGFLKGYSS